jgi:zinc protease
MLHPIQNGTCMRRAAHLTSLAVLTLCAASAPKPANAQSPTAMVVAPPPKPFVLPADTRIVLPNGLTVLMLEKHDLPLVSISVATRSGSVADPDGKEGLAVLTAGLLRKGTATRSAEQVSNDLDFIGMQYGAGASFDSTTISADFLKKDQATALGLLTDLMLHPAFPEAEVTKALAQQRDSVRAGKDNPQAVLALYYRKFLYGSHPYGRPTGGDEASLKNITRDDVLAFYKTNYTPGNTILAVAGGFDAAAMKSALQQSFGAWSGAAPKHAPLPTLKPETGRRLLFVDKPDATQTYFSMGNIGVDATNPDRAAIQVVNTLYGGRFTSLFNTELRIKSGYSYGASSSFTELRAPGPFTMTTYTRNATTVPAMDRTIEVVNTAHANGFTEEQLTSAKNSIAGSLPPQLETSQELASVLARNELYGITRDQFNQNLAAIQKTTVVDEKRVLAQDFPTADNLVIVVIGKASDVGSAMSKYAPKVSMKKIGDPGY